MVVNCVVCGAAMQIADGTPPGQRFVCPHCRTQLAYWGRNRIMRVNAQKDKSSVGPKIVLGLLVVTVAFGLIVYKNKLDAQRMREQRIADEQRARDEARAQNEQTALDESERKRRAEQRSKDAAEREKRREEAAKREAEREKRRQAEQERVESERRLRELFEEALKGFAGASSVVAADFPEEKSPLSFKTDGRFFAADLKYVGEQKMYEVLVAGGKLSAVRMLSRKEGMADVSPDDFKKHIDESIVFVKGESGPTWICGRVKSRLSVAVPEIGSEFTPLASFLGDGHAVMRSLKIPSPDVKFRLTLQGGKPGGDIPIGVFKASENIGSDAIRAKTRERLTEQKLKDAEKGLKPPKMKKVKRTVVFYEGEKVFKAMNGITKVPRSFKFFGTSRFNDNKAHVNDIVNRAKRQWEALCEEARRQEAQELEVEAQNRQAMEEYRRKVDEAMRNARATADDVDAELKKFKLLVERSKSKLPVVSAGD